MIELFAFRITLLFQVAESPCFKVRHTLPERNLLELSEIATSAISIIDETMNNIFFHKVSTNFIQSVGNGIWLPYAQLKRNILQFEDIEVNKRKSSHPIFSSLKKNCFRIIEIRQHVLGNDGVIIIIENVFSHEWTHNKRYVIIDSKKLYEYVIGIDDSFSNQYTTHSHKRLASVMFDEITTNIQIYNKQVIFYNYFNIN